MKSEIDSLMQARNIDALLITGPTAHNPSMVYFTGGGHVSAADLILKRGQAPVLFYNSMERDEAAKTGLPTKNLGDYNFTDLLKEAGNDYLKAAALRYQKMLTELGVVSGRVSVSGQVDAGYAVGVFSALSKLMPEIEFIGETNDSVLLSAMSTKDPAEIERIRKMGQITTSVVGQVADFLTSHKVEDEVLVKANGQPLTVGDVKSRINLWLAELGAEAPEGTIFAIGRDAGVPHSSGNPGDWMRLGQTIVFDIFPCEEGGGYYYDFTRTWCLGYAPAGVQALYENVRQVYNQVMSELQAGLPCYDYQKRTCELFEAQGHATTQTNPSTTDGYVHSLGHGLGLHVHERPWFGKNAGENDRLFPGVVVTIEPGLYYPDRGMGVRLEDTVWVTPSGEMEVLAPYPHDLVLPMKA